jgi:hypothetical protein
MDENTPELTPESHADASADAPLADAMAETAQDDSGPDDDGRTFDYDYVKGLREEAKSWRIKAAKTEELQAQLGVQLTRADGRLADPADLPFDPEYLTDPQKHADAITELLKAKPHYATRRPAPGSTIHQGPVGEPLAPKPDLVAGLRAAMNSR